MDTRPAGAGKGNCMPRDRRQLWNSRNNRLGTSSPGGLWRQIAVVSLSLSVIFGLSELVLDSLQGTKFFPGSARAQEQPAAAAPPTDTAPLNDPAEDDAPAAVAAPAENSPSVVRFDVPLPISGLVDMQVQSQVEQALRRLPPEGRRPTFVFQFHARADGSGEGSDFARSLTLARYLTGDRLAGVRTVAWLPRSVKGHAVLPVLACEQIVIQKEAQLGAAGIDEKGSIDALARRGYAEIADRRKTIPTAVALGLLDKDLAVFKVKTPDGLRYELADDLAALREAGKVTSEETLLQPGDMHLLSGIQLRDLGFASHLADDLRGLATALDVPVAALQKHLMPDEGWRPVRIDLAGPVHRQAVTFLLRTIDDHVRRGDFNLLVIYIRSGGGSLDESRRLAEKLATIPPNIHTVAVVDYEARSDAVLVATSTDELLVTAGAMLGGAAEGNHRQEDLTHVRSSIADIARINNRDWSLPMALVDPRLEVFRYTRAGGGEVRFLSSEEHASLPDAEEWSREGQPLPTSLGITGQTAAEWGLARTIIESLDEVKSHFQLEGELVAARPNWALALVEWLANPWLAWPLLFIGFFALMIEFSSPGIGVPGFVSALCFLLFFWSHFLHGTAGWLEVLLFVGGLACLAIELFVVPGFGVFGIGGGLMIIASIILASQTFVVPTNAYQMRQFPISIMMVGAGMAGGLAAIAAIRRFLPDTPYFNRMMLKPPAADERDEIARREALAEFGHLLGKRGVTTTPLFPAGKAQFGDDLVDVRSEGEFLTKGTPIVVVEAVGSLVIVRRAPDA
jgi:membrane-bound serine protease (ClpP class)